MPLLNPHFSPEGPAGPPKMKMARGNIEGVAQVSLLRPGGGPPVQKPTPAPTHSKSGGCSLIFDRAGEKCGLNPEMEHRRPINAHCDALQNAKFVPVMPSPRALLPPASADDQTREPIATIRRRAAMSMSTAPRDLAAIKHALELGLILATLIIATIMIVEAFHDDARKLTPEITIGQVMLTPAQAI
jgi:hypothetical protein